MLAAKTHFEHIYLHAFEQVHMWAHTYTQNYLEILQYLTVPLKNGNCENLKNKQIKELIS